MNQITFILVIAIALKILNRNESRLWLFSVILVSSYFQFLCNILIFFISMEFRMNLDFHFSICVKKHFLSFSIYRSNFKSFIFEPHQKSIKFNPGGMLKILDSGTNMHLQNTVMIETIFQISASRANTQILTLPP